MRASRPGVGFLPFVLIAVLGTLTTIGMGLDTTAVLLTPVVLALSTRLNVSPVPFALLAVWIATTASLLLPVSNLTNLLAAQRLALSTPTFAAVRSPAPLRTHGGDETSFDGRSSHGASWSLPRASYSLSPP